MASRECPFCREEVHEDAVVCKHCRLDIAPGVCLACKKQNRPEAKFCGHCGSDRLVQPPKAAGLSPLLSDLAWPFIWWFSQHKVARDMVAGLLAGLPLGYVVHRLYPSGSGPLSFALMPLALIAPAVSWGRLRREECVWSGLTLAVSLYVFPALADKTDSAFYAPFPSLLYGLAVAQASFARGPRIHLWGLLYGFLGLVGLFVAFLSTGLVSTVLGPGDRPILGLTIMSGAFGAMLGLTAALTRRTGDRLSDAELGRGKGGGIRATRSRQEERPDSYGLGQMIRDTLLAPFMPARLFKRLDRSPTPGWGAILGNCAVYGLLSCAMAPGLRGDSGLRTSLSILGATLMFVLFAAPLCAAVLHLCCKLSAGCASFKESFQIVSTLGGLLLASPLVARFPTLALPLWVWLLTMMVAAAVEMHYCRRSRAILAFLVASLIIAGPAALLVFMAKTGAAGH